MMKLRNLIYVAVLFTLSLPATAQSTFMLSVSPANAQSVISGHGGQGLAKPSVAVRWCRTALSVQRASRRMKPGSQLE